MNHDNPVRLDALVDGVDGSETPGTAIGHDDTAESETIRTELHHAHLPKLAEAGWIEYDSENGTVRYETRVETIRSTLQTAVDELDQIRGAYEEQTPGPETR